MKFASLPGTGPRFCAWSDHGIIGPRGRPEQPTVRRRLGCRGGAPSSVRQRRLRARPFDPRAGTSRRELSPPFLPHQYRLRCRFHRPAGSSSRPESNPPLGASVTETWESRRDENRARQPSGRVATAWTRFKSVSKGHRATNIPIRLIWPSADEIIRITRRPPLMAPAEGTFFVATTSVNMIII
jgi:hypothetical protein